MRATIGERLGLVRRSTPVLAKGTREDLPNLTSDDAVPLWVQPENVLRLADLASADTAPYDVIDPEDVWEDDDTDVDVPRYTGHMEYVHKTAPYLVIHGRTVISPEEYAASRRR